MKIALCQLDVTTDYESNIRSARAMLLEAGERGAQIAVLPEMFTMVYSPKRFCAVAEACEGGEAFHMLSQAATRTRMAVVGGTIPEKDGGFIYNTSMCFDQSGEYVGKYRKAHLFDVALPGKRPFRESDALKHGDGYPLYLPQFPIKTGVCVCFDVRFPEWQRFLMKQDIDLLALPAAFSNDTGPRHWELLLRARALDNQCFVAGVSPAHSDFVYGHSMLAAPDGSVVYDCGEKEGVYLVELDFRLLEEMRQSIPVKKLRRLDLYDVVKKVD